MKETSDVLRRLKSMWRIGFIILIATSAIASAIAGVLATTRPATAVAPKTITLYDDDPRHLWNQLHQALFVRTNRSGESFGLDVIDPLLWSSSTHLLTGGSHRQAIEALDAFIATDAESLIDSPMKKAVLQRDLWAVFDFATEEPGWEIRHLNERRALQQRLVTIIRRLALTDDEIIALPDVYATNVISKRFSAEFDEAQPRQAFLPADLFEEDGPWIRLSVAGDGIAAPAHLRDFRARSVFESFFRHPEGRGAGLAYLKTLSDHPSRWIIVPEADDKHAATPAINPALPQFPVGTQVALVRRMLLIDRDGALRASRLIESVQLRTHLQIPGPKEAVTREDQTFVEFVFRRADLFRDAGQALHAVTEDEEDFPSPLFSSHGIDPFEQPLSQGEEPRLVYPVLSRCFSCHSMGPGVQSFHTFTRAFGPTTLDVNFYDGSPDSQEQAAIGEKKKRFDWGLLTGLREAGQ